MILKTLSMGKQPVYYVQKSYRNEDGKPSTKYVERLGTLEDLEKRFGREDPIGEAKKYVAELTAQEKENRKKIILECNPPYSLTRMPSDVTMADISFSRKCITNWVWTRYAER